MSKGPEIITFGCRLNAWESEVMRDHASCAGLAGAVIVNTCAVTAEAERQARQAIRKARRDRPQARIIVTGCSAQIDPAGYAAMAEVDQVIGNDLKLTAAAWQAPADDRIRVNDIMSVRETAHHLVDRMDGRTRAFIQVQQGCDHRCTFCIIPFGRGNARSVPVGVVVDQVRTLVANGYKEIVLSGVDLTSWGADLPGRPKLGQLVRRLLAQVPDLPRLRLSSIDPAEMDDDLWRQFAENERLAPHLHLSVQAGDDMVLKRMKRRHDRQAVIDIAARIRDLRPGTLIGADLIAGFPTESDAMFANSEALIGEAGLVFAHVFPYSPRPGTPAARMPQVPKAVAKERAARLRAASASAFDAAMQARINTEVEVLIEQDNRGRAADFTPVALDRPVPDGALVAARITHREGDHMQAVPL